VPVRGHCSTMPQGWKRCKLRAWKAGSQLAETLRNFRPSPPVGREPSAGYLESGYNDTKGQGIEPAQRMIEPPLWFAGQFKGDDALGERAEQGFALEPRDRLANAAVNARAESHVPGRAAPHVELVRSLPATRVAIGCGQEQQHLLALAQLHSGDFDSFGRRAEESLHGRLETQNLFERQTDQRGVLAQGRPLLRMACETIQRVAEPIHRGIDSG